MNIRTQLKAGSLIATLAIAACGPATTAPSDARFKWELSSPQGFSGTIFRGGAAQYTIEVLQKVNLNSRVSLSARSEPAGLVLAFDPPRIAETARFATLRVSTTPDTPFTHFDIWVTAIEDGVPDVTGDRSVELTVAAPAGAGPHVTVLVEPAAVTLTQSLFQETATLVASLTSQNGFRGRVALAMTGLGDDLSIHSLPASIQVGESGSTGFAFSITFVPQGTVSTPVMVVLTANAGGVERSFTIQVNLPSQTSAPGQ